MTERVYRFVQVDVFTEAPLRGNPLAVFPNAEGITDAEMQLIAREMNLSETTFVLPPTQPRCVARVRIFTPGQELPFAGHPTIGTSFVLAREGLLPPRADEILLEEGIGPVPVRLEGEPSAPRFIWMQHGPATFGPPLDSRAAIAEALHLKDTDLIPDAPIQSGSTGVSMLYVPLRDREAVDRAAVDGAALYSATPEARSLPVFVFAPDPDAHAGRVYSRMFGSDAVGIPEDPATGSASGPLGAYLVRHRLVSPNEEVRIVSEQGTKMGRQSFIHIRLRMRDDEITSIEVGGSTVSVIDGTLRLP